MWKTVVLLIVTLLVVPTLTFFFDKAPVDEQKDVLVLLFIIYIIATFFVFFLSSITKNYSQVDKLWSIMPIVYVWVVCFHDDFSPRTLMMAILVSLWGLRLTYNFNRRGGYSWKFWEGEEDYRWAVLRSRPEFSGGLKWLLFNLFFISIYQMALILLFTTPIVKSMNSKPLTYLDWCLALIFIGLLAIESIADQQQWNYHKERKKRIRKGEELGPVLEKGFVHKGLWKYFRHPNYASEQAIWIVFYFYSVISTGIWVNWSVAGCLLLIILFKGSSDFSEKISASKYPDYESYKKQTGRFFFKIF